MSNNKQSMKLYTEEEILSLLKIHLADEDQADSFVSLLTPIKLPSDEEIQKISQDINGVDLVNICGILECKAFNRGAKWMRDKIQGGNNEQQ